MVRLAVSDDLRQIMTIVSAVKAEMQHNGNDQWDDAYPLETDFSNDIANRQLYVVEVDGQIIAFICINDLAPEEYAGATWSQREKSLVLHRMAVHPGWQRGGVGFELMQYAEELARSQGVYYLRSDTYSQNPKMNSLFRKLNYRFTGEIYFMRKAKPFNCYEKALERDDESR